MKTVIKILFLVSAFQVSSCTNGNNTVSVEQAPLQKPDPGKHIPSDSVLKAVSKPAGKPSIYTIAGPVTTAPVRNSFAAREPESLTEAKGYNYIVLSDTSVRISSAEAKGESISAKPGSVVKSKDAVSRDRNPYSFKILGKLQGLNHNIINCMFQDRSGFLWFGSDGGGLSRYDGSTFTFYTEKNGLANNYVYAIEEDLEGNIWIATRGGLSRFDGLNFTNYSTKNGLVNDRIQCLAIGYEGEILAGTYGDGLVVFTGDDFRYFKIGTDTELNRIHAIAKAGNGQYWIGTEGGGLIRSDGKRFELYRFTGPKGRNSIRNISVRETGETLFSTDGGGILIYKEGIFRAITTETGLSSNSTTWVSSGMNGEIWIAYVLGGISMYNGSSFTHLTEDHGLVNNSVISILFDRFENMWLSSYGGGLARYQGNIFTHFTSNEGLANNNIYGVALDSDNNLWLGPFGGGLQKYDGKDFTFYPPVKGINDFTVLALKEDRNGHLWAGTSGGGFYSFDGGKITHYTEKQGVASNYVFCIMEDHNGVLWLGTYGGGISLFDGTNFTNISTANGLSGDIILSIFEDSRKDVWIGTSGGGVTRITNGEYIHYTADDGLGGNNIYSIAEDLSGNIWFGTNEGGATVFDGQRFRSFTEAEGLSNNVVLAITSDANGNMWFGTRNGLNRLSPQAIKLLDETLHMSSEKLRETLRIRSYLFEDGFLGIGCSRGSIAADSKGTVWIGANDMLTSYHPEGEKNDAIPPEVFITGIELFDEVIPWDELNRNPDSVLVIESGMKISNYRLEGITKWYGLPIGLSLSHRNNYLTFTFTGIADNQNKNLRYQYMLEGLDQGWSSLAGRNYASFGNLAPAKYRFIVKAQNRYGLWSKEVSLEFEIRPPFTGTIIFKVLMIMMVATSVMLFFRWRIASLRAKKNELEREVNLKTAEVVKQNLELQNQREELEITLSSLRETQKQLIISEKMASLGVLSAGVAHEINNPLNFIQGGALGIEKYFNEKYPDNAGEIEPLLDVINVGVKRAAEIVTSLNQFSRQDEAQRVNCDIHVIIENCLRILQNELKNRIKVTKNFTTEPYELICNEGKLHQAFLNILHNASQAIAREGTISIETAISGNRLTVSVKDSGHGIPKDILPKIMDPFFTTKEPGKGTGLGLSITYNIIREHNGSLEIDSAEGEGTGVKITLPLGND